MLTVQCALNDALGTKSVLRDAVVLVSGPVSKTLMANRGGACVERDMAIVWSTGKSSWASRDE
jgi:hypothetical protein